MFDLINKWLMYYGVNESLSPYFAKSIIVIIVILLSVIADLIAKKIILNALMAYVRKSKNKWDDKLLEKKVFERISHIAPVLVVHAFASTFPAYQVWIERFAFSYMIFIGLLVADSLLDAINDIYRTYEVSKVKPIKGYLQVVKIFVNVMGVIAIIGIMINRSPWLLLSGIGAMTAVVLLIFKDSILGLVASIQLTANDMVHLGDWIEMSKYGADGEVIDITLHTIKVQNWDKTITTIPTYALISDSFKNWKGMQQSGGRRIKRAVYIDMTSIKFCTDEMLDRFEKIHYLTDYIQHKRREIEAFNKEHHIDTSREVNGRRLTNIGTFRAYIQNYLRNHPNIHHRMTLMVRQLSPTEYGLPIEIYAFTNDTAWASYESIQADIFDHIFAVIPEFDLRIFQNPTGYDLRSALNRNKISSEGLS
ncbi:MAG: miniconductance mechanosensitive channel [Clostridiales bacterium]|nr:miniconductance mechanosensitive channel [Clostridiales bacterium]